SLHTCHGTHSPSPHLYSPTTLFNPLIPSYETRTNTPTEGGPNYKDGNPALAAAVAAAKAANVTSAFIERAIARGQARSLDCAAREKVTVEAVLPGNVALILDVETDSRLRSLQDLNSLVKKNGGKPGSTLFYFEHCG